MSGEIKVLKISPTTGTDVTLGDASDTFTVPSGSAITVASGGDINVLSGGEIDIASGATLDVNGTIDVTGATVTGLTTGKVLQMVSTFTGAYATGSTTIPFDDTIPQITEGNEVMTLAITPTSATSKLLVNVDVSGASNVQGNWTAALFRDSTANALAAAQTKQSDVNPDHIDHLHLTWVADADSTSATTFKVRCGQTNAGDWYFNGQNASRWFGGASNSGITITEISA